MNIVIVGAGTAGLACIENIEKSQDVKLHLIEKNLPPFRKHLLFNWLTGAINDSRFFISLEELTGRYPCLSVIHDKAVRINFDKKKIFFKQGEPLDFDKLILSCGVKPRRLEFSGSLKQGVHLLPQAWPPDLKKDITIFNHLIVAVETLAGIELALKLADLPGKEIKVIAPTFDFVPQELEQRLKDVFKEGSVDLYSGVAISEVLGESRAKAVKLSSGKFLACDTLILDTPVVANLDIVRDSPGLLEGEALKVDEKLKSAYDFLFVCGSMSLTSVTAHALFADNAPLAQAQARVIAKNIFGAEEIFSPVAEKNTSEIIENILVSNKGDVSM